MSAESLRETIADVRRERRRVERELNRVGMVLLRLSTYREAAVRSGTGRTDDVERTGQRAIDAFKRFVVPGTDETPADRREVLGYLRESLLDAPGRRGTVDFFKRADAYRSEAGVPDRVWRVVTELDRFLDGRSDPDAVVDRVRRLVAGRARPADLDHLHALVGFIATATRRQQTALDDRLNSAFDGVDVVDAGLIEAYLGAVGDDPLAGLEEQPIVMLPVRLETRFVDVTGDGDETTVEPAFSHDDPSEFRIRVYPDQVHVDAHEPALTDEEVRAGQDFWAQLWYACHHVTPPDPDSDEPRQLPYDPSKLPLAIKDRAVVASVDEQWDTFSTAWPARYREIKERAWRRLVEGFGRERAAYLVHTLKPTAEGDRLLAAGDEDDHPWEERNARIRALEFPEVPRRPDAWTAQPRARLLPDRWVAHATWRSDGEDADDPSDDVVRHVSVTSRAVRDPLAVGPAPETVGAMADEATGEGESEADDGLEGVPAGLEWLVEFDEARRAGMAMTITEADLGADPATGTIETLLVVGVKTSMTGDDSVAALRRLLDAHHYSEGLAFLEGGTPSNNADVPSAYTSAADPLGSLATELGAPLVDAGGYSDGDRLARALGLDADGDGPHVFGHVANADGTTDRSARHMNNALWPATFGYSLTHLLVDNRWGPDPSLWTDADDVEAEPPPDDPAAAMREGLAWLTAYRRHYVKYVRGDGPFPTLRVGQQPYGVLPVTPVATQAEESADEGFTWYDAWRLTPVFGGSDDDTPEPVTDFTPSSGETLTFGQTMTASQYGDTTNWDDTTAATMTDGAGGFVPRRLERKDDAVVPHLATWVDRFAAVWRDAVQHEANTEPADDADPDRDRIRPVPRVGEGLPLTDVLEMEAASSNYVRKSVFTDPLSLWEMVGANDADVADADLRDVVAGADRDLTEADVGALIGALDPPAGRARIYEGWGELFTPIEDARERQRQEIRETLRAYDLTDLDPRVANFLYEDALSGDVLRRTITRLVDDDIDVNLWLLQHLSFTQLRDMGVDERAPGAEATTAGKRKLALIEEQRSRYRGTEPVVQKSLLRVLLRFSTLQEFVAGRIQLGALYDDPVDLGPDPAHPPDNELNDDWIDELADLTPEALAAHPALEPPDMDRHIGRYIHALEYFRKLEAEDSPVPAFSDFTYSLNQLMSVSTDELSRQFTRSMDLASHRLDAWWTSIATRRLFELRTGQGAWVDRHRTEAPGIRIAALSIAEEASYTVATDEADAEVDGETGDDGDASDGPRWEGVYLEETETDLRPIEGVGSHANIDATTSGPLTTDEVDLATEGLDTGDRVPQPDVRPEAGRWLDDAVERRPDVESAVYVGAYGFVEDVTADPATGDTEFLHAPSTQHATTAALLRSAHQSHEGTALADALAIDLSADRVRLATGLLDGVRNGHSLGALLGYRFERALHEDPSPLQQYIPAFRELAPGVMGRLRHGGEADDGPDEDDVGTTAAKSDVVDGYRLYQQYVNGEIAFAPVGSDSLSEDGLPAERTLDHVFEAALADPIDALNDLLTAESVHQLAKGNVERASGSVDSLVQGRLPQEPEVSRTTRSSRGITHRQLVLLDVPPAGESPTVPSAWDPATPVVSTAPAGSGDPGVLQVRPMGEPLLNAWVAELFPEPGRVSCHATFRWTDADGTDRTHGTTATLADLELSPLDALYLTQEDRRAGTSQLEGRFDYHLRRQRPATVPLDADLELAFARAASEGDLSVVAFLELASAVRTLVLDGRAADGEDLAHPADGLGPGFQTAADGPVDPRTALADRLDGATARLEAVTAAIDDRTTLLEPPDDEPNVLARVDDTVAAVEAFAGRILPRSAVATSDGDAPSPAARLEAFQGRVRADDDVLTAGLASTPDALLAELQQLRTVLPAGPTDDDADVTVEPGVPLGGTADEVSTGTPPSTIDLEAWSRSPVSAYREVVEDVAVDASGDFEVGLDVEGVAPGTPIQVVGRAAGSIVYSAQARVAGEPPEPAALATLVSTELPTVAALLDLAGVRDRLDARDGPGRSLQAAIDALEAAPHPSAGPSETAVTAERLLVERLVDAGETTLDGDDLDDIDAIEGLVGAPGEAGVELSVVVDGLDDLLEPLDRLGLSDLVTVNVDDGEPSFWRGGDREAGWVRERLATVDPDPRYLVAGPDLGLLRFDPTVARYTEASLGRYAGVLLEGLEALLDAPASFVTTLDRHVPDAESFLHHLSLLLYHPDRFGDVATPAGFADRVDTLADSVAGMSGLVSVLGGDAAWTRSSFERFLRAFHAGGRSGTDLEGFLSALVAFFAAPDPDPGREELHTSLGLPDPDGRETFETRYRDTLADADADGALAGLTHQLDLIGAVLEAEDPATAFRAGVYETVRGRLLQAAYFGDYGSVPISVDGGDPADEPTLVGQLRAAGDRLADRLPADDVAPATLDVPALVDRLEAVFGEPFVVLPPFVAPNAGELERTFGTDLLGDDPMAPETWLQRAAHVRERPAGFREALSYAEAATGTLLRDLSVGQLPETGPDAWIGRDGVEPSVGQLSLVVQAGHDLRFTGADGSSFATGVAGLFVDEWVEPVPAETETTGIALNFDDPGSRAPQSILLAVPPAAGEWSDEHLRTAVSETLGLAKLRLVDAEALAAVEDAAGLQHLLGALWFPRVFEPRPSDPSVNFEALDRFVPELEPVTGIAVEYVGFDEADGDADGGEGS